MKKQNLILDTFNKINKDFGSGSIQFLGSSHALDVERISSGCLSLDLALGGGLPKNRIIEIYGNESSGKTTLASHIVAEFQKEGIQAAFIDAEHAFDPEYAKKIGVNTDDLLFSQPDCGEDALEIVESLIRTKKVGLIVVDSVAVLTPRAEIQGEMGGSLPGLHARLIGQAMRKLTAITAKSKCTLVFLNQLRMKIGVQYGTPYVTTGGNALKFYASVRISLSKRAAVKDSDEQAIGDPVTAKISKNKVAPPFRKAEFEVRYNIGIDKHGDILNLAVGLGIVEKKGSFFTIEERKFHGFEKARLHLIDQPEVFENLKTIILDSQN